MHANRLQCPIEMALLTHRGLLDDENTATYPNFMNYFTSLLEILTQRRKKNETRIIVCTTCQHTLGYQHNILESMGHKHLDDSLIAFVSQFVDSFWKGYRPVHPYGRRICSVSSLDGGTEEVVVEPLEWMVAQCFSSKHTEVGKKRNISSLMNEESCNGDNKKSVAPPSSPLSCSRLKSTHSAGTTVLHCPQCQTECGYVRDRSLSMCLKYVLVDAFVLRKECFRNKREIFLNK